MSDTNDTTRKASGKAPLILKKTETSTVKQSFSHGRTKAVVVEKKRTRVEPGKPAELPAKAPAREAAPAKTERLPLPPPSAKPRRVRAWCCAS